MVSGEGSARYGQILREATRLAKAGKLAPQIDPTNYSPENASEAHEQWRSVYGRQSNYQYS